MSARESSRPPRAAENPAQFDRGPGMLSLALGVILGPAIVLLHQETVYAVNMWACGRNMHGSMHLVPILCLIVVGGAGYGGYRNWVATGRGVEDEEGSILTRSRFLALLGMSISALSALLIAAQWLAIWIFDPCLRA